MDSEDYYCSDEKLLVPTSHSFLSLLLHYSGLEEAVYRNIQACKELAQTTRTAYGPNVLVVAMFSCLLRIH
uniref:Uncharacterized protein n=1 Tax=Bubo bubo TaxID=30461 RepID=A0A8C0EF90_BUBBB